MRRRILLSAGAVTAGIALVGTVALAGGANAGITAAAKPGPGLNKAAIVKVMTFVDNYWVKNGTDEASNNWKNATFHVGNLAYVTTSGVSNHITLPWATANKFKLPTDKRGPFFPDTFAPGEVYLDLQAFHPADSDLADLRKRIKAQVTDVKNGNVSTWNYVDALNMAMPEYARMGVIDKNSGYLSTMQTLFNYTEKTAGGKGLYSEKDSLWWRDSKYVNTTTFWSRGNGWAFMALAKVINALMKTLPKTDPRLIEYKRVFVAMATKLKSIQRSDGFWNVDLGDAKDFPGDETTGTAMFTYGISWGINHGLLKPADSFKPVVEKAWVGMVNKAVQTSGLLGFCQGTGQRPSDGQPVTKSSTSAVGVGAFLLAGSQLALLEPPT
jgi:unsaturated rhamnogalacturonyl hydrolase